MQEIPANLGGSSVPNFAKRWNVPVSTVWAWIADGRLKVTKLGPRATRIPLDEEQRLIDKGMR